MQTQKLQEDCSFSQYNISRQMQEDPCFMLEQLKFFLIGNVKSGAITRKLRLCTEISFWIYKLAHSVTRPGLGPEWVCLRLAGSVWVLQERFHNRNPCDFGSMFTKAGDNKAKEKLKAEEATREK